MSKIDEVNESYVEKAVIAHAAKRGYLYRKMQYIGRRKAPDRFFFGPNAHLIIIEFKRWRKVPDEGQEREIERLRNLGFEVHVVDNVADGMMIFP